MIPDIGWSELLVLGVIALIVIGPKDLPRLMRSLGQMMAKARHMANEFRSSFDEMAREAELEELKKDVRKLDPRNAVADIRLDLDPTGTTPRKNPPPESTSPPAKDAGAAAPPNLAKPAGPANPPNLAKPTDAAAPAAGPPTLAKPAETTEPSPAAAPPPAAPPAATGTDRA